MSSPDHAFPYSLDTTLKCIVETEKQLREFVDDIMTEKHGLDWARDPAVGFSLSIQEKMRSRQQADRQRVGIKAVSPRLLDYSYMDDLAELVTGHWRLFKNAFHSKKEAEYLFDVLVKRRDFIAHGRDRFEPWEYHLCLGICGQLQAMVRDWYLGLKRRIANYSCEFSFVVDSSASCARAIALADEWFAKIKALPGAKFEEKPGGQLLLRLPSGHCRIVHNKRCTDYGKRYVQTSVSLETHSESALETVLAKGGKPYCSIITTFAEVVDLARILANAESAGRKNLIVSESADKPTSIGFILDEHKGHRVRAIISQDELGPALKIAFEGSPGKGFYCAHNVLTMDVVQSVLYYDIKPRQARRLALEAMKPG